MAGGLYHSFAAVSSQNQNMGFVRLFTGGSVPEPGGDGAGIRPGTCYRRLELRDFSFLFAETGEKVSQSRFFVRGADTMPDGGAGNRQSPPCSLDDPRRFPAAFEAFGKMVSSYVRGRAPKNSIPFPANGCCFSSLFGKPGPEFFIDMKKIKHNIIKT
jgi:hypothetical protein